jgi:hypothetical protein
VFGFLLLIGITLGAAVGGLVAVIVDRSLLRRAREVGAVQEVTVVPAEPEYGDVPDGAQSDSLRAEPARDADGPPSGSSATPRP